MPLSGTPAPIKRKKGTQRIITDLSHITQEESVTETGTSEFDLGRKIGIPKDIMLEELSLLKNKGSLMFKMRQKRVDRFIYENNPDAFTPDSNDHYQKYVAGMGGKMDVGGHLVTGHMVGYAGSGMRGAPVPPPKPGSHQVVGYGVAGGHATGQGSVAGGKGQQHGAGTHEGGGHHGAGTGGDAGGAGGAGGSLAKKTEYAKTYVSPWERAMKGNADLVATLKPNMPIPEPYHELRKYKSFNRTAMPYGGFEKASQLMTFQLPEVDVTGEDPVPHILSPHDNRPSFNRTPIGWIGSGDTSHIHLAMETVPFDGETDEL